MFAVARGHEIGLTESDTFMSKYPFSYRERAFVVFGDAVDIAFQDPVLPIAGPKQRKAIDEFEIGMPTGNSIFGKLCHELRLVQAQRRLVNAQNDLSEGA